MTYTWHSDVVNNSTPSANLGNKTSTKWTWSNTANYDFNIGADHNFIILAGMELHKDVEDRASAYAQMFALENYDYMWPDAATGTQRAGGIEEGYNLVSFFGKLDYNWKELLLADRKSGSAGMPRPTVRAALARTTATVRSPLPRWAIVSRST